MKNKILKLCIFASSIFLAACSASNAADIANNGQSNNNSSITDKDDKSSSGDKSSNGGSSTHHHDWDDGKETKAPTCTEKGVMTFTCKDCGATDTFDIDPVGHTWDDGEQTKPATCLEKGEMTYTCLVCGEVKTEQTQYADHDWDEGEVLAEATCTSSGKIKYTCGDCDREYIETINPLGHDFSEEKIVTTKPTCTKEGKEAYVCSRCGAESDVSPVEATGHLWNAGVVALEPTCEKDGYKVYTCVACGVQKEEVLTKLGHKMDTVEHIDREQDCEHGGLVTHHCERCGKYEIVSQTNALNHDWEVIGTTSANTNSYGSETKRCKTCGKTVIEQFSAPTPYLSSASYSTMGSRYVGALNFSADGGSGTGYTYTISNVTKPSTDTWYYSWSVSGSTLNVTSRLGEVGSFRITVRDSQGSEGWIVYDLASDGITSRSTPKGYSVYARNYYYAPTNLSLEDKGDETWVEKYQVTLHAYTNTEYKYIYTGAALENLSVDTSNPDNLLGEDFKPIREVNKGYLTLKKYDDGSYKISLTDSTLPTSKDAYSIVVDGETKYNLEKVEEPQLIENEKAQYQVKGVDLKKNSVIRFYLNGEEIQNYTARPNDVENKKKNNAGVSGSNSYAYVETANDNATVTLGVLTDTKTISYFVDGGRDLLKEEIVQAGQLSKISDYTYVRVFTDATKSTRSDNYPNNVNLTKSYSTSEYLDERYCRLFLKKGEAVDIFTNMYSGPFYDRGYMEDNQGTLKVTGYDSNNGPIVALEDVTIDLYVRLRNSGYVSVYVKEYNVDPIIYPLDEEPQNVPEPTPVTPDPVTPDPVEPDPVTPDPVTPDPVEPDPTPSTPTSYSVTFKVTKAVEYGKGVFFVSNKTGWGPSVAYRMSWTDGNVWVGNFTLPTGAIEYKYVVADYNEPGEVITWESGDNRSVTINSSKTYTDSWK